MSNPFATPATASGIKWEDHKGRLLIVEPLRVQEGIDTNYGKSDAVAANVHSLTGPTEAEVFEDCLIFPKVLQGQLRPRIGQKVLGRLVQGQAKPGQSAPWMLQEATEDDNAKGVAYLASIETKVSTPAPAAEAPAAEPAQTGAEVPF